MNMLAWGSEGNESHDCENIAYLWLWEVVQLFQRVD